MWPHLQGADPCDCSSRLGEIEVCKEAANLCLISSRPASNQNPIPSPRGPAPCGEPRKARKVTLRSADRGRAPGQEGTMCPSLSLSLTLLCSFYLSLLLLSPSVCLCLSVSLTLSCSFLSHSLSVSLCPFLLLCLSLPLSCSLSCPPFLLLTPSNTDKLVYVLYMLPVFFVVNVLLFAVLPLFFLAA